MTQGIDEDGYLYIMSRTDDVINVAGTVCQPASWKSWPIIHIAECAVIGVADQLKGQLPLGFICLYPNGNRAAEAIIPEAIALVKDRVGRVSAFNLVVAVDRLRKNPIGKSVAWHNGQDR